MSEDHHDHLLSYMDDFNRSIESQSIVEDILKDILIHIFTEENAQLEAKAKAKAKDKNLMTPAESDNDTDEGK